MTNEIEEFEEVGIIFPQFLNSYKAFAFLLTGLLDIRYWHEF